MKKILYVASECTPFFKSGGLADVIGSLPQYLNKTKKCEVRVILPLYKQLKEAFREQLTEVMIYTTEVGWRQQYTGIYEMVYEGVHYYFVDNEYYFNRESLYGYIDDGERFIYFSNAVIEFIYRGDFKPDVLHGHDWQAAAAVAICNIKKPVPGIRTVFTIHNILYQGWLMHSAFEELLNLDRIHFAGFEWGGMLNLMKAGIFHADKITTVSPTYAEEIKTDYYGEGLQWMLQQRNADVLGIVNGINVDDYNPMKDPNIPVNYKTSLPKKRENKKALQQEIGLPVDADVPMFSIITRMVEQKGLHLVMAILEEFVQQHVQIVILGNGLYEFESYFNELQRKYPEKVQVTIGFDEGFSRRIYAASDFFIMPSLFEPCGLSQLIALQYKAIPIVRETGGLKDTVIPYNIYSGIGTGLTFANYNAHELLSKLNEAVRLYRDPENYKLLLKNISKVNNSWAKSAAQYLAIY
ncbi:glycogen synthase [Macrococcus equipercicus]|uniref:Glycogen synthase n=1 Tax=Macrococcus equipercicus TaxID=69967 RepID=A0A9Q9BXT6_9STAP|nr:glycogen/starch synthase [Macrococcus equipercicus]UTH14602.1 glycogen synthase [Macrococcus equipercicus]